MPRCSHCHTSSKARNGHASGQRIRLVQDLWDSVIDKAQSAPIPLHHKRLIDQRLAAHEADPTGTISLAEAKRQVNKRVQQRRTGQ